MNRLLSFAFMFGYLSASLASAQEPGVEVLARGPVHEAYASTAEYAAAGPVVIKLPPQPVEELPPDQKPGGENVQWLPGYWHFDEERADYVWISGFWRVPPPGRVWQPGSWREVRGGWQWAAGFWQAAVAAVQQAPVQTDLEYLPQPPVPLELMPSIPAPTVSSFFVPGSWVWRDRFFWRPGFWMEVRPDWVWVPAQYRYTPGGYVFIEGYWDYTLANRGVLFAPVYFQPAIVARRSYVYTPTYLVSHNSMVTALFIRRGYNSYYFGDYFEPRYANAGFAAWCGTVRGTNFAVSVGFGRGATYDPLWAYYQTTHRNDPRWIANMNDTYAGRFRGDIQRPPQTLVQQNNVKVVNNTTNNTTINNTTVVNNYNMVAPISAATQTNAAVQMRAVPQAERVREQEHGNQLRNVSFQRQKVEANLAAKAPEPGKLPPQARQAKVEVPQQVVARAQAPATPEKAPPQQPRELRSEQRVRPNQAQPATEVKPVPLPTPKPVDPKPLPVPPKGEPKPVPLPTPKPVEPKPEPKPVPPPKVEPKPVPVPQPPKVEPKPVPVPPKPEPKPIPVPPKQEPKPVPPPVPVPVPQPPKVEPKPVPLPPKPFPPPKVEPKPVPVPQPPRVEPRPVPVPPKVEPKPVPVPPKPAPIPVPPPKVEPIPPVPPPTVPVPPKKPDNKKKDKKEPEKKM